MTAELEYLLWFYRNADFGPAHGGVMLHMNSQFTRETGKPVPAGYKYDEEE